VKNAVSESNNMQQKQSDACHCYCKSIMPMMQQQAELMTELIKQNNELITQAEGREQYLIEIIEINNELIAEQEEAGNSPQYLDMDSE